MSDREKWQEAYGPKLGVGVFCFPFLPFIFAANHVGYLVTLPLGLYASYAIIDTTEKLKTLIVGSKVFQKKLLYFSLLNLFSIWVHPVFGGVVTVSISVYCHSLAPKDYEKYITNQHT